MRFASFVRGLAHMAGGVAAGQLLVLAASPLLTRLYTPEDFGIFGMFSAAMGILGMVVSLRYEMAIPLVQGEREAAVLVLTCRVLGLVSTGVVAAALAVWHLAAVSGLVRGFPFELWWLVLSLAFWGEVLGLQFDTIRRQAYRETGINRFLQFFGQTVIQAGLGVFALGASGLVIGHAFGCAVRWSHYRLTAPASLLAAMRRATTVALWRALAQHRRNGLLLAPAALLQALSQWSPILLMALLYPTASVGGFTLAYRVLEAPVRLLASTASIVFVGEARGMDGHARKRLFVTVVVRSFLTGLLIFGTTAAVAPILFVVLFGPDWREAGEMASYLALLQIAKITVVPVSQAVTVMGRQDIYLVGAVLQVIGVGGAFLGADWLGLDSVAATASYAAVGTLCWIVFLLMSWSAVRDGANWKDPVPAR